MRNYSRITPEGTRDVLLKACKIQRHVEMQLSEEFAHRGYHEVRTPGLEYFDLFQLPGAGIPQEEMYKTTDNAGQLVVFRPDSTLPIARMTAARLRNAAEPIRLFYNQPVYRNRPELSGRKNQIPQMGLELLGAGGMKADLEILTMALDALGSFGADFRLEIGHAGLFRAFARRLPVSGAVREEIRDIIERKNYAALGEQLRGLEETDAVKAIGRLPRLFGDAAALAEAERYCVDAETEEILSYLKALYQALTELGYRDRIIVDLGLVQRKDYYSGVVFHAYLGHYGDVILTGGRYDHLLEKFDAPMPAIGFSIDTEALTEGFSQDPGAPKTRCSIVHWGSGFAARGHALMKERIAQGESCISSLFDRLEDCIAYGKSLGVDMIYVVSETVREIEMGGEG